MTYNADIANGSDKTSATERKDPTTMTSTGRIIPVVPGLLISMRTSIKGGVHYRREDLADEIEGAGTRTEWKTEKRVDDAQEYTMARRLRGRIGTLIAGACVKTRFTYICPLDKEQLLNDRIAEAQAACDAFNATATYSHVSFDLMRGRYTEDTRETVQAVRREIHELMAELNAALVEGKVEGIRDVAAKATQMGRLLEGGSEARSALERAIKESRRVATQLVKRIAEGADAVAEVLAGANVSLISTARHTFADDEMGEIAADTAPGLPAVALEQFADLDQEYVEPPAPELEQQHGDRGGVLVEALTEVLPEDTMDALDALSQQGAPDDDQPTEPAGVVVPLTNAASLLGGPQPIHQGMTASEALAHVQAWAEQQGHGDIAAAAQEMQDAGTFDDDALGEI